MGAFYRAKLEEFMEHSAAQIIGALTSSYQHNELQKRQIKAWELEIELLKVSGIELTKRHPAAAQWSLLLEYPIPRRSKRLDAVLLAADVIFCLEFKTLDKTHSIQTDRQAEDYALDLRDFHQESENRRIVPLAVVPKGRAVENSEGLDLAEAVRSVKRANASDLVSVVLDTYGAEHRDEVAPIDPLAWDRSPYRPVPTIIEAAEALFAGHNVREIAHSHAGVTSLSVTSDKLVEIIQQAQQRKEKVVCFVTGIPGAGKTLAGLNVIHNPELRRDGRPAGVFLSGNGPLVKIVSAAITRDYKKRSSEKDGERTVGTFIQNVHSFIRTYIDEKEKKPPEQIVVFDEAQRAWDADQNRKKNGVELSEPEIMLSIMNRHQDWAVLIALVGGGQEINSGEAGLAEWGNTLSGKYQNWKIAASPRVLEPNASTAGHRLFHDGKPESLSIQLESSLHLEVNQRSIRAQRFTEWVNFMLAGEAEKAADIVPHLRRFPFAITRSLATARSWLRTRARGQQRAGLVASSGAMRLRADGLELSSGFRQGNRDMYVNWFLAQAPDIRSSNQLEVAASEFECQGLELDWVGVCWGGDFYFNASSSGWDYRKLSGSKWGEVKAEDGVARGFLLNKYRVLLTRARRGLIIWVPEGDETDPTRLPTGFNHTAEHLLRCGVPLI